MRKEERSDRKEEEKSERKEEEKSESREHSIRRGLSGDVHISRKE